MTSSRDLTTWPVCDHVVPCWRPKQHCDQPRCGYQFSSVRLLNSCFSQSYNNKKEFSIAVRVSVMSSSFLVAETMNKSRTEKLCAPKPAVLVRGTTKSPWLAECKWRRVETAESGLIIDTRYGAASWWRHLCHLCTSWQILKPTRCRTRSHAAKIVNVEYMW